MDHTCRALPADSMSSFHDHHNRLNEHIQFTVKKEKDGVLSFLDVLLTIDLEGHKTSIYRKQLHTDGYLDYSLHHPLTHKKSVVTSLLSQAKALLAEYVIKTTQY